jgi:predicted DNA-binding antitoxin AbrB/MazE fold protein
MNKTVQAIYTNGTFRPLESVACQEEERRVLLTVQTACTDDDLLLDSDFLSYCETQADDSVSLEQVRQALAKIPGTLAHDVRADRDQR